MSLTLDNMLAGTLQSPFTVFTVMYLMAILITVPVTLRPCLALLKFTVSPTLRVNLFN